MYNNVIKLIKHTETIDRHGIPQETETSRVVFCDVKSVSQSEFYQAQANGLKPELKFVIADYLDYQNEKEVEFNNVRYSVLRTFRNNNELEITTYGLDV